MAALMMVQGRSVEVYVWLIQRCVSIVVKRDTEPKTDRGIIHLERLINSGAVAQEGKESAPLTLTILTHNERQPTHQTGDCTHTHKHTH